MTDARRAVSGATVLVSVVVAFTVSIATSCDSRASAPGAVGAKLAVVDPPAVDAAVVTIRQTEVVVDVARTAAAQRLGLGRYATLPFGRGMVFPYPHAAFQAFWMKGMHFDIDIVWIRDGRVVAVASRVPAPPRPDAPNPARVQSPELVDLVLEVPAGFARAHGWRRGDAVDLDFTRH
jgi:uncharacterized membrane protein (UPF0127 family)